METDQIKIHIIALGATGGIPARNFEIMKKLGVTTPNIRKLHKELSELAYTKCLSLIQVRRNLETEILAERAKGTICVYAGNGGGNPTLRPGRHRYIPP